MSDTGFSWLPGAGNGDNSGTGADDNVDVAPPSQKIVDIFHGRASTTRPDDIHHRIGFGEADAAAGNHSHDGTDSPALWSGQVVPLSGTPTTAQLMAKINELTALLNQKSSS